MDARSGQYRLTSQNTLTGERGGGVITRPTVCLAGFTFSRFCFEGHWSLARERWRFDETGGRLGEPGG